MSFFGDYLFFCYLTAIVLPALVLGIFQKNLKWYSILASSLLIILVFGNDKRQIVYFILFLFIEIHIIKIYMLLQKRYGKHKSLYRHFLLFSLAPLIICKAAALIGRDWFSFIGISYITFRAVQVIIEIYDGVIEEINTTDLISFFIFFPTISSGPIDRSRRYIQDLHRIHPRKEYLELASSGFFKIFLGIFYKFALASIVFQWVDLLSGRYKWYLIIAYAYCYGIYLFFDFAGYSLIAIGVSNIFGVETPKNFDKPFISIDMKDFWNRWHITLSQWFRDFIFSRFLMQSLKEKRFKNRLNAAAAGFILNMMVMGVWHGLTGYYIAYGLYHGVLLALTEIYQKKSSFYKKYKNKTLYKIASWAITINLVMFGFLIFSGRSGDIIREAISKII